MIFRVIYLTPYLNRKVIPFKRSGFGLDTQVMYVADYKKKEMTKIRA